MKNTPHPSEYQSVGPLFDKKLPDQDFDYEMSDFDGVTYEPAFDSSRLRGEMARVYWVMTKCPTFTNGGWFTLGEIATAIYYRFEHKVDSEAGISARIRDLRKAKFGSHTVNRRRRGEASRGIWEYQLL